MKLGKICTKGRKVGSGRQKLYVFSHTESMNLIYIKTNRKTYLYMTMGGRLLGKKKEGVREGDEKGCWEGIMIRTQSVHAPNAIINS